MILGSGMSIRRKVPKEPERPPESGTGSGHKAWRNYAEDIGLVIPEDFTKAEIIDFVDTYETTPTEEEQAEDRDYEPTPE